MPKYFYTCEQCEAKISVYHDMSEELKSCTECAASGSLKKLPSFFNSETKQEARLKKGDIVKKSINDFKEELDQQKNKLKNELYDPNK